MHKAGEDVQSGGFLKLGCKHKVLPGVGPSYQATPTALGTCAIVTAAAGYGNAVLTPNGMEFKRLAGKLGVDPEGQEALQEVAAR